MKTQINLSNLKKVAVTLCSTLVITSASFAVNIPEVTKTEKKALASLERIMNTTEASLRFTASLVEESEEVTAAVNFLDLLAENTQTALRYEAPEVVETMLEMERLEEWAGTLEAVLQYTAPMEDAVETIAFENDAYLLAEIR